MFVGIDPSITATGITVIGEEDTDSTVICPDKSCDLQVVRIHDIVSNIDNILGSYNSQFIVAMEDPPSKVGRARVNIGLFWAIREILLKYKALVFSVMPTQVKEFSTGYGNATKEDMRINIDFNIISYKKVNKYTKLWYKLQSDALDSYYMAHMVRAPFYQTEYSYHQLNISNRIILT